MSDAKPSNAKRILGARIAKFRKSKKLTQAKLAELIGIAPTTLTNIELGKGFVTAETLDKIKETFEVNYDDLFKSYDKSSIENDYTDLKNTIDRLYKTQPNLIPAAKAIIELLDR